MLGAGAEMSLVLPFHRQTCTFDQGHPETLFYAAPSTAPKSGLVEIVAAMRDA